jgi:hypothetical protein
MDSARAFVVEKILKLSGLAIFAVDCPANFVPVRNIRNWHERSFVWDEGRGINRTRW